MCGNMLLLRAALSMLVRNADPRGLMCFRCLMFSLSGPCDLLFLFYFVVLPLGPDCGECNILSLYFLYYSDNGSVCLCVACLTLFVNCLVKQFAIYLDVVVILLLNVFEVLSVGGGASLDRPCMVFEIMCVVCL